jgi:hypothetical protein
VVLCLRILHFIPVVYDSIYISIIPFSRITERYVVAVRIYAWYSRQRGINSGSTVSVSMASAWVHILGQFCLHGNGASTVPLGFLSIQ